MKQFQYGSLLMEANDAYQCYFVADCDKDAVAVEIPAVCKGVPVVGIRAEAFRDCTALRSVVFSDASKDGAWNEFYIGDGAFSGCTALTDIVIPSGTASIGWGAFRGCHALERVQLPDCYVEPYAFCHCEGLKEISPITNISEGVFSHCKSLSVFPVAPGTHTIGEDAFEHCYTLTEITIPASVCRIEQLAFRNCRGLKSVRFEITDGWRWKCMYDFFSEEPRHLDVSDPVSNANSLANADFDDGVECWFRQ